MLDALSATTGSIPNLNTHYVTVESDGTALSATTIKQHAKKSFVSILPTTTSGSHATETTDGLDLVSYNYTVK